VSSEIRGCLSVNGPCVSAPRTIAL
jgi:hypothetical protein